MTRQSFMSEIKLLPSLIISGASVAVGVLVNEFIKEGLGRATFLSCLMIMLTLYSSRNSLRDKGIAVCIFGYGIAHIFLTTFYGSILEHGPGSIIIFIAIMDYVLFFFIASFCYQKL